MEIFESKVMTAKRQKMFNRDPFKASIFKSWLISLLLLSPLTVTQAIELKYYYGGNTYNFLSAAEAAMRAAHSDDSFDPREDALEQYREKYNPSNDQVDMYYKINLSAQAIADFDRKYWYLETIPSFEELRGTKFSESELISDFLHYISELEDGYHCRSPDFGGFRPNGAASPMRVWRFSNIGDYSYPSSIHSGRLFYDRTFTIGEFIQNGWSSPESGLCCAACGLEGGGPITQDRSLANTSEYEVYICPEGYILGKGYRTYGKPK
ncbi:MAG: hypothetical protein P8163_02290, partial [Candidatus Thiodiazotropha sp.]